MSDLVDLHITPRGSGEIDFDRIKQANIHNKEKPLKIELSNDEVQYLISLLGEQPTKTGAWIVLQNITQQVQKQQGEENVQLDN
jgi:hypothetical protein